MRNFVLLCGAALVGSQSAHAQEPGSLRPVEETQITVTATGTRIMVQDTGQQVTVIGADEIERVQGPDLTRVLERVPAVTVTRNGGLGAFTGVRLRGAEAEQVLVLLDGVRVTDPASPSGGFDFGNLLSLNLEKLEILRGSNSTIWGSDAIGGVIVASTRAASGLAASAEYGSRDTFAGVVSGGVADPERGFLGISAIHVGSDGFSAAAAGTEPDGFEQSAIDGHGRLYISPDFEIFARGRYAKGELEIDGFPAPDFLLADTLEVQETRQVFASAGAVFDSGPLFLQAVYSLADTERTNSDPAAGAAPSFASDGQSDRLDVRGEWRPIGPLVVHFGAEAEWTSYDTLFDAGATTRIAGGYAQLGMERGPLSAHAGLRLTDHRDFDGATTFGADVSYELADQLRLRASVGEGFKAPSLFQLHSDYGNAALVPERSTSLDAGLAYGDRSLSDGPLYAALTLFRRETDNQIAFVSCFAETSGICASRPFGTYANLGYTRAQGIEFEGAIALADGVTLSGVYAFVYTEDRTPGSPAYGNDLARRPRHAATATVQWQPGDRLNLAADLRIVSTSFDDAANLVPLDGYELLTLRADLNVSDSVQLFGRIENALAEDYRTAAAYATEGRSAHIGARMRL